VCPCIIIIIAKTFTASSAVRREDEEGEVADDVATVVATVVAECVAEVVAFVVSEPSPEL
jgi:hypothetical protein